jgi:drug/metabolite transporter (DMT)-like permease
MSLLLAGLASIMFGTADFMGGLATRRVPAVTVVIGSQIAGLAFVLAIAPLTGGEPIGADILWGAAAGVSGAGALAVFYHALATTRVGVATPVAVVVATALQVTFGVVVGERPEALAWVGVALAVPAIALITSSRGADRSFRASTHRALEFGVLAGIGFGLFGVFISRTGDTSGLWPLVGARGASISLMIIVALAISHPLVPGGRTAPLAALVGVMDMASNVLFLLALRWGFLSLASVIMSLGPAATLTLARVVFKERIVAVQAVGLGLAAVGVSLIAVA